VDGECDEFGADGDIDNMVPREEAWGSKDPTLVSTKGCLDTRGDIFYMATKSSPNPPSQYDLFPRSLLVRPSRFDVFTIIVVAFLQHLFESEVASAATMVPIALAIALVV
jgi:hypothetical protein